MDAVLLWQLRQRSAGRQELELESAKGTAAASGEQHFLGCRVCFPEVVPNKQTHSGLPPVGLEATRGVKVHGFGTQCSAALSEPVDLDNESERSIGRMSFFLTAIGVFRAALL